MLKYILELHSLNEGEKNSGSLILGKIFNHECVQVMFVVRAVNLEFIRIVHYDIWSVGVERYKT